jgi:hypothetical protein
MSTVSGFHFCLPLDAHAGPASRISRVRAMNIVSAAMEREPTSRVDLRRPPARTRPWRQVAFLAAAALVLPVTVVAGAVRLAAIRHFAPATLFVAGRTPVAHTEPKPAPQPAPRAVEALAAHVDEAPVPNEMPAVDVPRAPETPRVHLPAPAAPRAAAAPPSPPLSPQDMLQNANDLRAQHQWLAATQVYEKTLRTFPGRSEAYSAMVAAGVLRLDQLGDPRGALALFSSALRARPQGALAEEARWGTIQAFRVLGDRPSEKAALQEFVTLHPLSLLASRAQARLREMRGESPLP